MFFRTAKRVLECIQNCKANYNYQKNEEYVQTTIEFFSQSFEIIEQIACGTNNIMKNSRSVF